MATSTAPYPIRPMTEAELPGLLTVHGHAFNSGPAPERVRARLLAGIEFDRSLAAFDGTTMVGCAGIFSFRMRVPGALVPVAGVTMVSVLPTHRRRGILSAMMRRQLTEIYERGEAVAALFASEAGIYGRYGYGVASGHAYFRLRAREGALAAEAPADGALRLRLADPGSVRAELAKVYELVLAERPGVFARNDYWWERALDAGGESGPPLRCLIAEDDAGPRGYALFTAAERWDGPAFLADSTINVREAMVTDPAAAAALWGDLLTRDLVTEFTAGMRPVDDPLAHLLADPRRLRPQVTDGLWVRLVDVAAALAQRRYASPVDVVIELTDGLLPHNQGRWHLATTAPAGGDPPAGGWAAACERTAAEPDVTVPVHALGAAYLGGTRLGTLVRAGQVTETRPGAVAALSTALSWEPAPWCPVIF